MTTHQPHWTNMPFSKSFSSQFFSISILGLNVCMSSWPSTFSPVLLMFPGFPFAFLAGLCFSPAVLCLPHACPCFFVVICDGWLLTLHVSSVVLEIKTACLWDFSPVVAFALAFWCLRNGLCCRVLVIGCFWSPLLGFGSISLHIFSSCSFSSLSSVFLSFTLLILTTLYFMFHVLKNILHLSLGFWSFSFSFSRSEFSLSSLSNISCNASIFSVCLWVCTASVGELLPVVPSLKAFAYFFGVLYRTRKPSLFFSDTWSWHTVSWCIAPVSPFSLSISVFSINSHCLVKHYV